MTNKQEEVLINEIRFRRWVQAILVEEAIYERAQAHPDTFLEQLLSEYGGGMSGEGFISAMVSPFTDVLNVAQVATKDLLSIAKFNFDMITTLSPSKQKAAREKWEARNSSLEKEWQTAMAPIDKAWEEGDAQLIGFMLNPAGFLGAKAAMAVGDTALGARDMLDDAGIHLPIVGGKNKNKDKETKDSGTVDILGTGKKLLGDLTKLFFIAHHEPAGALIAEASPEEKEEKKKSGGAESGAREYIDSIPGFQAEIDNAAKELVSSRQEYISEIMSMFEAQVALLTNLADAQDLKSFLEAIQAAADAGVDIGGAGLANFQAEIDKGVKGILSNPKSRSEFVLTYLESQGKDVPKGVDKESGQSVPEVSDEELAPVIQKIVFMNSKLGVQEKLFTGTQGLKKQATQAVLDGIPDQSTWASLKKSSAGVSYVNMIEDTVKKIDAA
jgi:hypothetical protein